MLDSSKALVWSDIDLERSILLFRKEGGGAGFWVMLF
jgi:hypothetical protein